jgi:FAD synthetase
MISMKSQVSSQRRRIVLASGVFDLLHLGHVKYLENAKEAGGANARLIVVVSRDNIVEKRKGSRPIMPENQRRALVESLKVVDKAILGYEEFDIEKIIRNLKPDIIAVGYDQEDIENIVKTFVKGRKSKIKVVRIGKFGETEMNSSSKIKHKIMRV